MKKVLIGMINKGDEGKPMPESKRKKYEKTFDTIKKHMAKTYGKSIVNQGSKSRTTYGDSWYYSFAKNQEDQNPFKIRISDHYVGHNRLFNDNSAFVQYSDDTKSIKNSIDDFFNPRYKKVKFVQEVEAPNDKFNRPSDAKVTLIEKNFRTSKKGNPLNKYRVEGYKKVFVPRKK